MCLSCLKKSHQLSIQMFCQISHSLENNLETFCKQSCYGIQLSLTLILCSSASSNRVTLVTVRGLVETYTQLTHYNTIPHFDALKIQL